ncbi:hypothetical protein [Dictyobacter arantiisoli]|uniref:hypothetical protein n=1 Tax=Dictyobacter arantiisoli TaxID=2014874 RepID=UPI0011F02824|nr:hypothetical protein [Dictyobacter arantiisoli]
MSHPEILKQKFDNMGVQRAKPSAGVWDVPTPSFPLFACRLRRREEKEKRAGNTPATPARGSPPLATPLAERIEVDRMPVRKIRDDPCLYQSSNQKNYTRSRPVMHLKQPGKNQSGKKQKKAFQL